MRYKEIARVHARYSFFGYLYMVEIIINNTRVLLDLFFYFVYIFLLLPLFLSVSLHCINSSRGKNNRGCSHCKNWKEKDRARTKIHSHSFFSKYNANKTKRIKIQNTRNKEVEMERKKKVSHLICRQMGRKDLQTRPEKPGQYPKFIDSISCAWNVVLAKCVYLSDLDWSDAIIVKVDLKRCCLFGSFSFSRFCLCICFRE